MPEVTEKNPLGAGRKQKADYKQIEADYRTGLYSVHDLCEKYKIKRTTLLSHFSRNGIEICDNLRQSIAALDTGLELLKKEKENAICDKKTDKERESVANAIESGIEYLEKKHGLLARMAVNIVAKSMKKTDELMAVCDNPQDFKELMQGFKTSIDAVGLFPKSPLIQVNQNNIQATKGALEKVVFEIQAPDVIDGEVED